MRCGVYIACRWPSIFHSRRRPGCQFTYLVRLRPTFASPLAYKPQCRSELRMIQPHHQRYLLSLRSLSAAAAGIVYSVFIVLSGWARSETLLSFYHPLLYYQTLRLIGARATRRTSLTRATHGGRYSTSRLLYNPVVAFARGTQQHKACNLSGLGSLSSGICDSFIIFQFMACAAFKLFRLLRAGSGHGGE